MDDTTSYTPLFDPETDGLTYAPSLSEALRLARTVLEDKATANIHDHNEMIRAAVGLEMRLRQLVAALDKKDGR
jgi:hypothetical protein